MLKCLHIITDLDTGGAEMMLQKLVTQTEGTSLHNEIVSLTSVGALGQDLRASGIRVRALEVRSIWSLFCGVARLKRWVTESSPDVVQTWMYHGNSIGGVAARLAGTFPTVWNIRASHLAAGSDKLMTRWLARLAGPAARYLSDAIVTNSHFARAAHASMGYPDELFRVIPNGFDLTRFRPDPSARAALRAALGRTSTAT